MTVTGGNEENWDFHSARGKSFHPESCKFARAACSMYADFARAGVTVLIAASPLTCKGPYFSSYCARALFFISGRVAPLKYRLTRALVFCISVVIFECWWIVSQEHPGLQRLLWEICHSRLIPANCFLTVQIEGRIRCAEKCDINQIHTVYIETRSLISRWANSHPVES